MRHVNRRQLSIGWGARPSALIPDTSDGTLTVVGGRSLENCKVIWITFASEVIGRNGPRNAVSGGMMMIAGSKSTRTVTRIWLPVSRRRGAAAARCVHLHQEEEGGIPVRVSVSVRASVEPGERLWEAEGATGLTRKPIKVESHTTNLRVRGFLRTYMLWRCEPSARYVNPDLPVWGPLWWFPSPIAPVIVRSETGRQSPGSGSLVLCQPCGARGPLTGLRALHARDGWFECGCYLPSVPPHPVTGCWCCHTVHPLPP